MRDDPIRARRLYYARPRDRHRARPRGRPITSKQEAMVWEERWHPLRREGVIVSSHRNDRPWLGETVGDKGEPTPAYVPDCYLCPRNVRISGARNPDYASVYVFDN